MSAEAVCYTAKVNIVDCATCGAPIALTQARETTLRSSREPFCCPQGHHNTFRPSETDRLKAELVKEKQRREMAEREVVMERKRAESAIKKHEREQKRVRNGVCPCCNRSFVNLQRHMTTKHPEEVKSETQPPQLPQPKEST